MSALRRPEPRALPDWAAVLKRDGYCHVPAAAPAALVAGLDAELDDRFEHTPFCDGLFHGHRTKRFHGLLTRSTNAAALVMNDIALSIAEEVLLSWCDSLQLNLTQAIEIHPGALAQAPHRDQAMFYGGDGAREFLVNVMWPLTTYGPANGGTNIWRGSHGGPGAYAPTDEDRVIPVCRPGDALIFLGSTLHGGGANRSAEPRRGVIVSYCLGWLKPYENMWLTYPPEVARAFPPELAGLVGYRQQRPNLGNYDGQCPSILLREDREGYRATVDDVTSAQAAALEQHARRQLSIVS